MMWYWGGFALLEHSDIVKEHWFHHIFAEGLYAYLNPRIRLPVCPCVRVTKRPQRLTHYPKANAISNHWPMGHTAWSLNGRVGQSQEDWARSWSPEGPLTSSDLYSHGILKNSTALFVSLFVALVTLSCIDDFVSDSEPLLGNVMLGWVKIQNVSCSANIRSSWRSWQVSH